jgi:hypothetical protein
MADLLAELDALREKATPGEFVALDPKEVDVHLCAHWQDEQGRRCTRFVATLSSLCQLEDACYLAALHNAYPVLKECLEDAVGALREHESQCKWGPGSCFECQTLAAIRAKLGVE